MSRQNVVEWIQKYWISVAAVLSALGLSYLLWSRPDSRARSLNEALLIAAVLTVTVDPFLKKRLAKEAGKDIFHHLLGLNLPPEIRERLKEFVFAQKYYRTALEIEAHAEKQNNNTVHLRIRIRSEVSAISDCDYAPALAFEEVGSPVIDEASITSSLPEHTYLYSNSNKAAPVAVEMADEPMVLVWKGMPFRLRKGEIFSSFFDFTIQGREKDFWVQYFGTTTINPRVRLSASNDLEIYASKSERINGAHEYIYERVFVPGDHIQIRWRPKSAPPSIGGAPAQTASAPQSGTAKTA